MTLIEKMKQLKKVCSKSQKTCGCEMCPSRYDCIQIHGTPPRHWNIPKLTALLSELERK